MGTSDWSSNSITQGLIATVLYVLYDSRSVKNIIIAAALFTAFFWAISIIIDLFWFYADELDGDDDDSDGVIYKYRWDGDFDDYDWDFEGLDEDDKEG